MSRVGRSHDILRYIRDLSRLLLGVEVTQADGKSVDFVQGIDAALKRIAVLKGTSRKLIFIGNGGSAAIASHQALDFWRSCGVPAIAFNDPIHLTCVSNDFGYEHVFSKPTEIFANAGDTLIAISSSGKSKNILRGVEAARRRGCGVVTFSGFEPTNPLRAVGDLNFYVPSKSYGHVELSHLTLIHAMADVLGDHSRHNGAY